MELSKAAIGFVVGILVGLTGMGGGAVMTPLLILLGWARPAVAVGTDLVWGTLTKLVGASVHYRQKTVDLSLVKWLAMGSVPGALLGILLLSSLRRLGVDAIDRFVGRTLGFTLICVACVLLYRSFRKDPGRLSSRSASPEDFSGDLWLTPAMAAVVGFLVSLTSVGSGSLIVPCLLILYPAIPLKRIVGSDIFHGLILGCVAAFGHLELGNINRSLLLGLWAGSIPGVWIGSKLTTLFPDRLLRPALAVTLLLLGFKLI
ncbi:MAG: sulfite exporter TauE/SafE family protein [Terriglobia bacterium]